MPLFLTAENIAESGLSHDTLETVRNCAYRANMDLYNEDMKREAASRASACYHRIASDGSLSHKQVENLLAFVYAHRCLHHAGHWWEAGSSDWFATCWLYLHLYRDEVPPEQANAQVVAGWKARPKGRAEAAAAEIRQKIQQLSQRKND